MKKTEDGRAASIKRQPISIVRIDNNSGMVYGLHHKILRKPQVVLSSSFSILFFFLFFFFLSFLLSCSFFFPVSHPRHDRKRHKCRSIGRLYSFFLSILPFRCFSFFRLYIRKGKNVIRIGIYLEFVHTTQTRYYNCLQKYCPKYFLR